MANPCALLLAEQVSNSGFKATLSGEGADEALAGYLWYRIGALSERTERWLPWLPSMLRGGLGSLLAPGTSAPDLGASLGGVRPSQLDAYEAMCRAKHLFYSASMSEVAGTNEHFGGLACDLPRIASWHPRNRDLYFDYRVMLAGHLLIGKGDRVAMHSAVELRFPYLDEEFVQLCASLPVHYKLRGSSGKWLLRQVAQRVLPAALARRPKGMFKAKSLCALGPLPRYCEQLVSPESLSKTGYFSVGKVQHERRLQRWLPALAPRRYVADAAFSIVVTTQLWHHLYLAGGLCELPSFDLAGLSSPMIENIEVGEAA
jgi:asparagine synthase (glutamine-hydrolysing)